MFSSSDLLHQLVSDRQQELLRSAAAGRNAQPSRVRRHLARTLRRAADRLDVATAAQLDEQRTPRTRVARVRVSGS